MAPRLLPLALCLGLACKAPIALSSDEHDVLPEDASTTLLDGPIADGAQSQTDVHSGESDASSADVGDDRAEASDDGAIDGQARVIDEQIDDGGLGCTCSALDDVGNLREVPLDCFCAKRTCFKT